MTQTCLVYSKNTAANISITNTWCPLLHCSQLWCKPPMRSAVQKPNFTLVLFPVHWTVRWTPPVFESVGFHVKALNCELWLKGFISVQIQHCIFTYLNVFQFDIFENVISFAVNVNLAYCWGDKTLFRRDQINKRIHLAASLANLYGSHFRNSFTVDTEF